MNHTENRKKQIICWAFTALILALIVPGVHAGGVDLTTVETGTVNGDIAILPGIMWNTSWTYPGGVTVTQDYTLPAFDTVQWARLYVSVYCAKTSGASETFVNISLDGDGDGTYSSLADEYLNSTDMDELPDRPYITRESSNYVMWYNVTDAITASTPSVQVNTTGSYDGRVKAVTLVVAYNDGREQTVDYWVNQGHYNGNDGNTVFDASALTEEWLAADVTCLFLSSDSSDCTRYTLNDINLTETDGGKVTYSGYRILDATDAMETGANTFAWPGAGTYYRIPLAVLAVTSGPAPDLEVTAVVTNSDEYFAHEPNWIKAAVLNNGTADAGAFDVAFTINGTVQTISVPEGLPAGNTTVVEVTDMTDYHLNDRVNITVTADPDNAIAEPDETDNSAVLNATVVYNGYKGKRYTDGEDIETRISYDGTANCTWSVGDSAYVSGGTHWTEITTGWTAEEMAMPTNATLRDVRLYVPYTWDKNAVMPDTVTLTFNGNETAYAAHYADQKSYGSSNYPYGMLVYNVTGLFSPDGNTAVLTKTEASAEVSMRGMTLVAVYEDAAEPVRSIFINEGFDLLYGDASKSTTPEEATAYAPLGDIDTASVASARLITFAPGADGPEGTLIVNNDSWTDVWSYIGTTQIGIDDRDVTSSLTDGNNTCAFQSDAEYIEASGAILIIERAGLADFTATPTSGTAPLTVRFTDLSVGATSWAWDFENDGIIDETIQNPSHIYNTSGTYTVNLTVSDGSGSDTKIRSQYIQISPIHNTDSGDDDWEPVVKNANTGTLLTSPEGKILRDTTISAKDGIASLNLGMNTYALDSKGNAIKEVTITSLGENGVSNSPGVTFLFTGNAYECTPSGATFSPAITLTLTLTPEQWNTFADGELSLWFYNEKNNIWEEIPVIINPSEHTVTAKISHFSRFALFSSAAEVKTTDPKITQIPEQTTPVPPGTSEAPLSENPSPNPTSSPGFGVLMGCTGLLLTLLAVARRQ